MRFKIEVLKITRPYHLQLYKDYERPFALTAIDLNPFQREGM